MENVYAEMLTLVFINPHGTITLTHFYYLIQSGALAGGKSEIPKGFRASRSNTEQPPNTLLSSFIRFHFSQSIPVLHPQSSPTSDHSALCSHTSTLPSSSLCYGHLESLSRYGRNPAATAFRFQAVLGQPRLSHLVFALCNAMVTGLS
ncbi:hypothetical protein PIB30_093248 [Stylosanthes scabra]|uniref:Uncharacterized protein n=1 Tax=Stylosanthes scabra TaxID=79078 RepID=A0ABU6UVU6_9FABA|nr:hypothetical protein [Stylosanthes scabra]